MRAFVQLYKLLQDRFSDFCGKIDDTAVFKGQLEFIDNVAVMAQRLGARNRSFNICLERSREYLFSRQVGQEGVALFIYTLSGYPDMAFRQSDRNIGSWSDIVQLRIFLIVQIGCF
ncbi:hypothetical protein D3C74_394960 [compost metagenome]